MSPSPSVRHQAITLRLATHFQQLAETTGGITLAAPLDVVLAEHTVVQPDVIYVCAERRHIVGDVQKALPEG